MSLYCRECTEVLLALGKQGSADQRDRKLRTAAHCGAARGRLDSLKVAVYSPLHFLTGPGASGGGPVGS